MHPFFLAALVVTAIAAFTDWRTGHIPNWLTFGTLAVAPIGHALVGFRTAGPTGAAWGFGYSVAGIVLCSLVPGLLFVLEGMYAGDVKILAALGALMAPMLGIEAEFYSFIVAALYAPARLAYEGKLLRTLGNSVFLVVNPFLPKEKRRPLSQETMSKLRFGPSVFAGTVAAVLLNWSAT